MSKQRGFASVLQKILAPQHLGSLLHRPQHTKSAFSLVLTSAEPARFRVRDRETLALVAMDNQLNVKHLLIAHL